MSIAYNSSIVTSGLVLCLDAGSPRSYPGSGTAWRDVSGNGTNGTLINGPTYSGNNLGYLSFDGVDDYVECSTSLSGISGNVAASIGCWFMAVGGSSTTFYPLVGWGGSTSGDALMLGLNQPSQSFSLNVQFNGGNSVATADNTYALNTWYYFACTKTPGAANTTTKIYLNAQEQSLTYTVSITPNFVVETNRIGQWVNPGYTTKFPGRVSNTQMYNRALSATEVLQNFNALRGRYGI